MDSQKQRLQEVYQNFTQKMSELFSRKKNLITDFKRRLETRKINKFKEELMQK